MPGTDVEPRQDRAPVPVPGMPQRKRESEAAPLRAWRSARRNRHVSVPLAVPVAAWTAAEIMHAFGMGGYAGIAGLVLAGNIWYFAPRKWTGKDGLPRWPEVWYARASAAALWLWLWAAASAGPSAGPLAPLLVAAATAWGIPWYRHKRPRGMKKRERLLRQWQAFWEGHAHAWDLGGSRVIDAEEKRAQIRLRVQLQPGRQSLQHAKGAVHLIESALQDYSGIGMVRVTGAPGNASQVEVFLKRENPLRDVIEWDPALAPRSVHDPAVLGVSETSDLVRAPQRTNAFVNGKTRSGKSNHLALRLVQLTGCPDDRQVVIDLKKRSARPLLKASAVDCVITDRDEARDMLRMLCAEIAARSRDWDTGEEQALATPSSPALHVLVDEVNPLASVTAGTAECARYLAIGASQGSGLEVYYEVYTQYGALEESVQTEQTRANLPLRACYATETAEHGAFALGDGWKHDASKLEEKGEFLLKLGPRARDERIRAPHVPHRLLEEITAANARDVKRPPRLQLWCGGEPSGIGGLTWQEWWDRRWLRIDPALRSVSPQYAEAAEEFGEPKAPSGSPSAAAPPPGEDPDTGAAVAAAIARETEGPDLAPTAAAEAAVRGTGTTRREKFAAALASAAPPGITRGALAEASGYSPSLVSAELKRLAERGAAVSQDQRWLPVPGRDVLAELLAAKAGDDALLHLVS